MMELNKYDLVEWVADILVKECPLSCMFGRNCKFPECNNKEKIIKELIKKYNL